MSLGDWCLGIGASRSRAGIELQRAAYSVRIFLVWAGQPPGLPYLTLPYLTFTLCRQRPLLRRWLAYRQGNHGQD